MLRKVNFACALKHYIQKEDNVMDKDIKVAAHYFNTVAHDKLDKTHQGAVSMPIYQTSIFAFENYDDFQDAMKDEQNHHIYSRGNNPTVRFLEDKLAKLEGGESAKCFASGMAAISSALHVLVGSGDHIICVEQAYGPAKIFMEQLRDRFNVELTFVSGVDVSEFEEAIQSNTKLIYLENPSSVFFKLQNLPEIAQLAKRHGIITMVDNSWASPCFQQPLSMGIDLVVHSLSKYVSGHSDCLGGVVIGHEEMVKNISNNGYQLLGGIMTPHVASLMMRGLRTLPLRMQYHHKTGLYMAQYMEKQSYVSKVNHPGLPTHPQHKLAKNLFTGYGSLFTFESPYSVEIMRRWAAELNYFRIAVSWGGYESLVTVHQVPNKTLPNGEAVAGVLLFIGMEDPETLKSDMEQAWEKVLNTLQIR